MITTLTVLTEELYCTCFYKAGSTEEDKAQCRSVGVFQLAVLNRISPYLVKTCLHTHTGLWRNTCKWNRAAPHVHVHTGMNRVQHYKTHSLFGCCWILKLSPSDDGKVCGLRNCASVCVCVFKIDTTWAATCIKVSIFTSNYTRIF